jgi:asparagine synthase (glutamine-hydrolysing)
VFCLSWVVEAKWVGSVCGIAGWLAFGRDLAGEQVAVEQMTATMRRRGPDGMGVWVGDHAVLGHHRLAVVDIPGGRQPMVAETASGPVVLVYSGEIYNYGELREELTGLGHRFATAGDTEVVLLGYLQWGDRVAERLNGMYAFAVWDSRTGKLVLIRDRLGVKPLFYYPTPDGLLFGSEAKAILAHPLAAPVVDLDGLRTLVAYTKAVAGCVWSGMRELAPGHVLTADRGGLRERRYWRLRATEHAEDLRDTTSTVRGLLENVVRRQLVCDVPLGVLLSGGLDSSVLTALAAVDGPVATFSVDFAGRTQTFASDAERPTADGPFVRDMITHVGSEHVEVLLDHAAVAALETRRKAVRAYDLPPGFGDRDRSMYLLFSALKERVTVALSGESADELFGGYAWAHDPAVRQAPMFPWITAHESTYGLPDGLWAPGLRDSLALPAFLADTYATCLAEVEHPASDDSLQRRLREVAHLQLTSHLRVLLDRKDRLSMAAGLEVRVPYCDHRLVEYVYNAPWPMHTFDGREKSLLRAATADLLPASIRARVKSAYPSVQGHEYDVLLQHQAKELAGDAAHPVFDLVSRRWLTEAAQYDTERLHVRDRHAVDWVLNLAVWLELYHPVLKLG